MAFADPQSVTIGATTYSLPRVSSGTNTSTYQSSDGLVQLVPSSLYAKRTRRSLRLNSTKIAADPFTPSVNQSFSMSTYLVVDIPIIGFTVAEQTDVVDALSAYMAASSGAAIAKLLGGEN